MDRTVNDFNIRSAGLLGIDGIKKLHNTRVLLVGLGGVGGYALEALVRIGVGTIGLCDGDEVVKSNLNRQILATHDTVGVKKTDAAYARALSINPDIKLDAYDFFYNEKSADKIPLKNYDYIIDAIDSVKDKILLILNAKAAKVNIISSMGAGNRTDPTGFEVADIYSTKNCPLAKKMRGLCRQNGITELNVVYSAKCPEPVQNGFETVSSVSFVPPVAGMILASKVIKDIVEF